MNPLVNGKYTWQADPKLEREKNAVFERVAYELNSGILQTLRLQRERDLNGVIAEQCFADDFNYLQAARCEKFVRANDFKMNLIQNFAKDHLVKHQLAYDAECINSDEMKALGSVVEKDRAYVYCHNHFLRRLRQDVLPDLEEKARDLFN